MSCCSGLSDKLKGTVQLKIDRTSVLSQARWLEIGLNHCKSAQRKTSFILRACMAVCVCVLPYKEAIFQSR